MGGLIHWEDVLADNVVKSQVHLVHSERLLKVTGVHGAEVLVQVAIVDFKAGELGVFDSHVDTNHR